MVTVTRMYDDYTAAQNAVAALEQNGIPSSDISIVASNAEGWYGDKKVDRDRDGTDDRAEGAAGGAGIGAGLGGAAGLLTGLGIMAIPGVGPIVAAGWLAATAAGAAAGGAAGGIIGALTQAGVSDDDAHVYSEGLRRGGTMVTVRTDAASQATIEKLLSTNSVDVSGRSAAWREAGWQGFDANAKPLTSEQIKADRARYL